MAWRTVAIRLRTSANWACSGAAALGSATLTASAAWAIRLRTASAAAELLLPSAAWPLLPARAGRGDLDGRSPAAEAPCVASSRASRSRSSALRSMYSPVCSSGHSYQSQRPVTDERRISNAGTPRTGADYDAGHAPRRPPG